MSDEIRAIALKNAVEHGGKASIGPVMGRVMASFPDLKEDPRSTFTLVKEIVNEVNALSLREQNALLQKIGPPKAGQKKEKRDSLPDLEGAVLGMVVMRFAPGPSGPLHIGHSRAVILNDEYVKMYRGRFILRIEDTNPAKVDLAAYDTIPEDLEWLGVKVHDTYIQSDRFELYYKVARELLERGAAYICTCDPEQWRSLKDGGAPCPHRDISPGAQLDMWDRMMDRQFKAQEASYVVKTDLSHKNPAVRDFIGFRIVAEPHPRIGDKYHLYPLYNFSVTVDDHLMECSHILRGKDHLNNTLRQEYVYRWMGWELPVFIHYGWVSIEDSVLKKSLITEGIRDGSYSGWDDVRLGTFRSLRARGYRPEAIRRYWKEVGLKQVDILFSWDNLNAMNKELVDDGAKRMFYVREPVLVNVSSPVKLSSHAPYHPEHPDLGIRAHEMEPVDGMVGIYLESADIRDIPQGGMVRLKDLANITRIEGAPGEVLFSFSGNDLSVTRRGAPIIHWVPEKGSIHLPMEQAEGDDIVRFDGILEPSDPELLGLVQFERIGFVNIIRRREGRVALFAHR